MPDTLPKAVTTTDLLIRAVLDELQGLRADMATAPVAWRQTVDRIADDVAALKAALPASPAAVEPADGETVELREPGTPPAKPGRKRS